MKKLSALLLTLFLNQGCGGGGGDDSNTPPAGTYGVSGTITGLAGNVTLSLNGTEENFTNNGDFSFATRVTDGENYQVSIAETSTNLTCSLANSSGQSEQDITNIEVTCNGPSPTAYNLSGLAFNTESPSIITFAFHLVDRYTGLAIDDLDTDNVTNYLHVLENGSEVSPSESFLELAQLTNVDAEYNTVFAIDISSSLSNQELTEIKSLITQAVFNNETNESKLAANQFITILTFDSQVNTVLAKSQDVETILETIGNVQIGGNSTNLYGAIEQGVNGWENEISLDLLSYGNLILFTDGNDTSGVVSKQTALTAAQNKDIYILAIGDEVDTTTLEEFTHENNIFSVVNFDQLSQSLDDAFDRVKTYEDGLYIMSYATPKRAGDHTLTVTAIDDYRCDTAVSDFEQSQISNSGVVNNCEDEHSYTFDADNFTDVTATLELTGVSFTTSPEVDWYAALRWSRETPEYNWQIKVCFGDIEYQISPDDKQVSFSRNGESAAVAYIELSEDVTMKEATPKYLIMARDTSNLNVWSQNNLAQICNI